MTGTPENEKRLAEFLEKSGFGVIEDLHPDLQKYLNISPIGEIVQHPLVYSVPHHPMRNANLNRLLERKKINLINFRAQKNWGSYIFTYERPYRLEAMRMVLDEMSDFEYWNQVSRVWTDSENIYQNFEEWVEIWSNDRPEREATMDEDELAVLNSLPDSLTVYRGVGHEDAIGGLSWTTDKDRAVWFAKRFSYQEDSMPILATMEIDKSEILAYFGGRNESEVVIIPGFDAEIEMETV